MSQPLNDLTFSRLKKENKIRNNPLNKFVISKIFSHLFRSLLAADTTYILFPGPEALQLTEASAASGALQAVLWIRSDPKLFSGSGIIHSGSDKLQFLMNKIA